MARDPDIRWRRNETSHAYNEDTAEKIAEAILASYVPEFRKLLETLSRLEEEEP